MNPQLQELVRNEPRIWRGGEPARQRAEASGCRTLDRHLPGGGWPVGALTELYPATAGIGEFSLLLPAIGRITQAGRRVALVAPPYIPYSQALAWHGVNLSRLVLLQTERPADALWALEQTLASGTVALAVAWPVRVSERELRRLQLAAETGQAAAVLYRPLAQAAYSSPAALRIKLFSQGSGRLAADVFKCRGGQPVALSLPQDLQTALPEAA